MAKDENPGLHWWTIGGMISIVVLCGAVGVILDSSKWLPHSGAAVVFIGVFIESRGRLLKPNVDEKVFWTNQRLHNSDRTAIVIVLLGTLVWGFGDIINKILFNLN